MATKIQVSRGSLHAKGLENLLRGELFYVPANENKGNDNLKENSAYPYDTGTLYIGGPSISGEYTEPIPIAGERAYKGLVYRGNILAQNQSISDPMFQYVRTGDFYIFQEDAVGGAFETEGYKAGDILVIKSATYNPAPDLSSDSNSDKSKDISYFKIAGSAGKAKNIEYDNSESNLKSTNVQSAIDELANTKITYKGTIPDDFNTVAIMADVDSGKGNQSTLESGSLYLVTTDNIPFYNELKGTINSKKGDLVIWDKDEGWKLIQCGYTDASDIDFDPTKAVEEQTALGTFTIDTDTTHIDETGKLTNLQDAVTYLLSHKAMLSSNGKVPLSQLPDTVLGAMQYCGTWDPINNNAAGVSDPAFQNDWPTGNDYDKTVEAGNENNNKPGDYYIVKTDYSNITYYNKKSYKIEETGLYTESVLLNNGDYVIYTVPRDNNGDYILSEAHWEVIDNSATITSLNFNINGVKEGDTYDYASETTEASIVGNPHFAADGKIVLVKEDDKITFAGVRLIDQLENDPNKDNLDNYIPVYSGNTNTIKRGTIKNLYNSTTGKNEVHTNADIYIGESSSSNSANAYVYGNIYINPHFTTGDNSAYNSGITFNVVNTTNTTGYFSSTLLSDTNPENGAKIYLPGKSSTIIGKLNGVTLVENYLTKVDKDGYITNSSLEEHMSNAQITSVEFHAPDLYVNRTNTRKIVLGDSSKDTFVNGTFDVDEKTSTLLANPNQETQDVTNNLPKTSGTLLNDKDWLSLISGTKGTLPVYGEKLSDNSNTLIDSKIKQISSSLYDTLFNSASNIGLEDRQLSSINVDNVEYKSDTDVDFANKIYGKATTTNNEDGTTATTYSGTDDNINISTDTIIGEIEQDINGKSVITNPKSLKVTKSFVLGNSNTNNTHLIPGRTLFSGSSQYYDPTNGNARKVQDVYVEMPSVSGVLLTDESVIDGGNYTES